MDNGKTAGDMVGENNYGMTAVFTKDIGLKIQVILKFESLTNFNKTN